MRIGVVTETKSDERRVALTPAGTEELVAAGHTVLVQQGAGEGSGFADDAYEKAGAVLVAGGREDLGGRRPAGQGERARRPRARLLPRRARHFHLPAPGGRPRAHRCPRGLGCHRSGVRDGRGRCRPLAAAGAHERDRRSARRPGRGALPDSHPWAGGASWRVAPRAWRRRGSWCWAVGWWVSTRRGWPGAWGQT